MVDIPWWDSIRNRRQLTVFCGKTVAKNSWTGVINKSITDFNTLSGTLKLGVTLATSSSQPAEGTDDFGGADIWVEAEEKFTFKVAGQEVKSEIGILVKGDTHRLAWDFGNGPRMRKATVLMKPLPKVDTHRGRVGDNVLVCFTVHEFIHAIGLDDHTSGGGDVFQEIPDVSSGPNPADDKMMVFGGQKLPPIILKGTTVNRIQTLWPSPASP
jgi:hypothetical protein